MILDTNALSAAAEDAPALRVVLGEALKISIPVIVLGEYRYGIAQSRYGAQYERWLDNLLSDSEILDIDVQTAHFYAVVKLELKEAGKPIPINDLWIAALCRQHRLPLLSRDSHFDAVPGIQRLEW